MGKEIRIAVSGRYECIVNNEKTGESIRRPNGESFDVEEFVSSQSFGICCQLCEPVSYTGFHSFDDDLISAVINRLNEARHLCLCARVSRSWRRVASNDEIWKQTFLKRWGQLSAVALTDTDTPDSTIKTQPADSAAGRAAPPGAVDHRSVFIRSATARVLTWGHGSGSGSAAAAAVRRVPSPVRPLDGRGVRQVSAGTEFACAVTWDGQVYSWGRNDHGQCGAGAVSPNVAEPVALCQPPPPPPPYGEDPSLRAAAAAFFLQARSAPARARRPRPRLYRRPYLPGLARPRTTPTPHACLGLSRRGR